MSWLEITTITAAKFQKSYFYLHFNDHKPVKIHEQVLINNPQIKEGAQLPAEQLDQILLQDQNQRALEYAYLLLSYSPRSQKAMEEKLQRKGFDFAIVNQTIDRLKEQKLLDDTALARAVVEQKLKSSNPVGERKLRQDLHRKGLSQQTLREAFDWVKQDGSADILDEDERAWIALQKRAGQIKITDMRSALRRLFDYLLRRGFSFDSANKALSRFKREYKVDDDLED